MGPKVRECAEQMFIRCEILSGSVSHATYFGIPQTWRNLPRDLQRNAIQQGEKVIHLVIKFTGPQRSPIASVEKLNRYSYLVLHTMNHAAYQVFDAQLPCSFDRIDILAL
jgi:hypothetical protein